MHRCFARRYFRIDGLPVRFARRVTTFELGLFLLTTAPQLSSLGTGSEGAQAVEVRLVPLRVAGTPSLADLLERLGGKSRFDEEGAHVAPARRESLFLAFDNEFEELDRAGRTVNHSTVRPAAESGDAAALGKLAQRHRLFVTSTDAGFDDGALKCPPDGLFALQHFDSVQ